MTRQNRTLLLTSLTLLCLGILHKNSAAAATPSDHWVGTWAASPMAAPNPGAKFGAEGTAGTTLREIVHISLGGSSVRVTLTNEFGLDALTIDAAQLALSSGSGTIAAGTGTPLTFSGRPSVIIPPGALIVSDPISLKVAATSDLAVSLFLPDQPVNQLTFHSFANQTNYLVSGNLVAATSLDNPQKFFSWDFLKGVDVLTDSKGASIVTFGDSITDGARGTQDANARWPDVLARRLQANKKTANLGVLNEGIGGNRILHDTTGPSALARFDRDVLAQASVKYLVILESINDIGHATDPVKPYDVVTAADLIAGLSQLATRAHTHGIKVIGATLTPFVGAKYQSADGEAMRQAINQWIRTTNQLDGVIDFDKLTTDPTHPGMFLPLDDSGDHLHPGDAGYKAMGESIDLNLFTK
ncbi:SGNH/GDSL hydrolase family protein [Granulicella sp. S190]|uniref:SGNH/GDSL hydrolase family protein n=1 Tax=Granulicella sp. S190 TaxID=1747226 RepID=UPI00131B1C14|nr:SGNH/GDSL hydrolase family protein [Granulicella sp. S190]